MTSLEDLYNTQILELAANIPLSGRLEHPDASATAHSKLCGSTITIDLKMDGDRVTDYRQTVKACLLGQSSASIMGRHVVGARAADLKDIAARMRKMLKEGAEAPAEAWPELKLLEPIRTYKARHASTMLVFDAVEDAIRQIEARHGAAGAKAN
jgi:NifU-like protein involved in Fe-S cluster formation